MTARSDDWSITDELFEAALDLAPQERAAFLDARCAGDAELRSAVDRLLRAHDLARTFLEQPAPVFGAPLLANVAAIEPWPAGTRIGAYTILGPLGHGGMGVVYRARDERLDRIVALKFLPPDLVSDEAARQRLIAEAKLASALDHPGIAVVHDVGETGDGHLFIAMACYEGETLAEKIARGPLPHSAALELAIQIADALAAAHNRGIVHRDIKPGNVIVTSQNIAKIVDFGIARPVGDAADARGTLAYMSPEQLRGDVVDARTDVWSFGAVLYEMVIGTTPYRGEDVDSQLQAILRGTPAQTRRKPWAAPHRLLDIAERCLAVEPANRYPDAGAVLAALRSVSGGQRGRRKRRATIGILAVAAVTGVVLTARSGSMEQQLPVIAVAALDEHGAADTARLATALRDMLATNLARVPDLPVVSNARMYEIITQLSDTAHRRAAWVRAAREAGATELLEGSLHHQSDGRLRLDLRRVSLANGATQGAHSITAASVFELADRATAEVASAFQLPGKSLRLADVTTSSLVAYRFYEEGLRSLTSGDAREAARLFEAAVTEDSLFAMAAHYLWMSRVSLNQQPTPEVRAWLLRLSNRAADRERLLMRGWNPSLTRWQAAAIADTVVRRYPGMPEGHLMFADHLTHAGDFDQARTHYLQVIKMDSLALRKGGSQCRACAALAGLWTVHMHTDSMAAAERVARTWVRHQPKSSAAWQALAQVLLAREQIEEALAARRTAATLNPTDIGIAMFPAIARIRTGDFVRADRLLREMVEEGTPEIRDEAIWFLCISLRHQGRLEEALALIRAARAGRPAHERVLLQQEAQVLFELRRYDEAAAFFDKVTKLQSNPRANAGEARWTSWNLTHVATARAAGGDTTVLAALADTIEKRGRESHHGRDWRLHHHVQGLLLSARGRHSAAAESFRRAMFSPTLGFTRTNFELARVLLEMRRPHEAVSVLQPALRGQLEASNLYITRTELHALLGKAWEAAGRADSAAFHYQHVLNAWQNADPLLRARRDTIAVTTCQRLPGALCWRSRHAAHRHS